MLGIELTTEMELSSSLQRHMIRCSGRQAYSSGGGVGYSGSVNSTAWFVYIVC